MRMGFAERAERAAASLPSGYAPKTAIVLGSGLSGIAEGLGYEKIPFSAIAEFPRTSVSGHAGLLYLSREVAIMAGRFHYYEGHSMDDVVLPIFVLKRLGVENLILTNAAGGINAEFAPGDLVLIQDHINMMGTNAFVGPNPSDANGNPLGNRFFDMGEVYSRDLRVLAESCARRPLKEGVYAALTGPAYETPAEIRMLRTLGADLVGMSTVPEATAARYLGMRVLGISCVTNMAAGIGKTPLVHSEVVEAGKRVEGELKDLLLKVLKKLA